MAKKIDEFEGLVEGDDGIAVAKNDIDEKLISGLGLMLKFKYANSYVDASFCGISKSCRENDQVICDPLKGMTDMFCIPKKFCNLKQTKVAGLMRARAISGFDSYERMPIVGPLYHSILYRTRGVEAYTQDQDAYQSVLFDKAFDRLKSTRTMLKEPLEKLIDCIDIQDRLYVQKKYGFEVGYQLEFENATKLWARGDHVRFPLHPRLEEYIDNFYKYVRDVPEYDDPENWDHLVDPLTFFLDERGNKNNKCYRPHSGKHVRSLKQPAFALPVVNHFE